jgi:hypothetical protein
MSKNYFAIERNGQCWAPMVLGDGNGKVAFEEFLDMPYDEMKASHALSDFVAAAMEAANRKSCSEDGQTLVTLVGEDNVFIWSVIIGSDKYDSELLRYALVDWKKGGKSYRYEP